jgi:hypothetical protein
MSEHVGVGHLNENGKDNLTSSEPASAELLIPIRRTYEIRPYHSVTSAGISRAETV